MKTIAEIKDFLYTLVYGNVCDVVYTSSLPKVLPDSLDSFAVVSTPSRISDITDTRSMAFRRGSAVIALYTKNNPDGSENVVLQDSMEKALQAAIASNSNTDYYIDIKNMYSVSSMEEYHVLIVLIDLTIK